MRDLDSVLERFKSRAEAIGEAPEEEIPAPRPALLPWRELLEKCRVPPKYLDVPESLPLAGDLAGWARTLDQWAVVFLSPVTGCGKTWNAVRLLGEVARRNWLLQPGSEIRFEDAPTWLRKIKDEIGTDRDGMAYFRAAKARLLLLDDLGAERSTDYQRDQLNMLLRERHMASKPTIVTTNSDGLDVLKHAPDGTGGPLDPRIVSRLSESKFLLRVPGKDRRLGKGVKS